MANVAQGMYAPLSQSMSDSDSEKELQIDSVHNKPVNGMHKSFERSSMNGYIIPNHMTTNTKMKHGFMAMSLTRKYCFLFSILVCFLTIAIFLWVLPCSDNGTCPRHISSWENQHEDFEFKGKINVVKSAFVNSNNLALLFKRSLNDETTRSGVISILGSNGAVAWYIPQVKEPTELNCNLIDVNGDDVQDCLLLGEMGLEAVDPISGQILYHVHNQNIGNKGISSIDMPVILPDLNKDDIKEMITTVNGKSYHHNKLVIVCGRTGLILSKIVLKHCWEVRGLKYENKKFLYSCKNDTMTKYYEIVYLDIENRYNNKSFEVTSTPVPINETNVEYKLNDHKLIINNTGICPDCQSTIYLFNKQKPIWSLPQSNCYVMKPAMFAFKSTKTNILSLKGHINGYILKLWQWSNYGIWKKDRILDKRYTPTASTKTNIISERIVLITFNDTNVHVINASFIEVTQLCFPIDEEYVCQPDLANQEESLLITDLDNDKSQELVSYSSTYELRDGTRKLISNMKVIRLEAELPKLYEVAK